MGTSMWTRFLADGRRACQLLLIALIVALFVAGFVVGFEFHSAPDKAAGATYPIMSDSGVVYTTVVAALISWSKFVLFGLLFLLQLTPSKSARAN